MASYSTIPAAEEPLVAKPQGKSLKALVAGAAVASLAGRRGAAPRLPTRRVFSRTCLGTQNLPKTMSAPPMAAPLDTSTSPK